MSSGNGARCALCATRLAGQDGTRFRSSSCRHSSPSPTSSTSPLGNVPGEWIRDQVWALTTMTMPARNLRIWCELLSCSWDPSYLKRQRLVSRWLNDLVPFPGEAYRQFVKDLVQVNKLVRGEFLIDGNAVDASQITCPVLVLAHTGDVLAPPESAEALLEVVSSADREAVTGSGGTLGHVDIVVGPEGPAIMWPKLSAWLEMHSGAGR
jgi:polyhydroxyalkanoate synthase